MAFARVDYETISTRRPPGIYNALPGCVITALSTRRRTSVPPG